MSESGICFHFHRDGDVDVGVGDGVVGLVVDLSPVQVINFSISSVIILPGHGVINI